MILNELKPLLNNPPHFIYDNTQFLALVGSHAFGVNEPDSDYDVYGWVIPTKNIIFPHTDGFVHGFNSPRSTFEQFSQTALFHNSKEYDITVFNITKFFSLCMKNNPNYLDTLFVPARCILHCTNIGRKVIENRKIFLYKGAWTHYFGFATSQIHKIMNKQFDGSPERKAEVEKYGYCLKFAYTLVRLLNEVEQILTKADIDLEYKNNILKAIRNGEWPLEHLLKWVNDKIRTLEDVFLTCDILPDEPRESEIKNLLVECLEMHYGDLSKDAPKSTRQDELLNDVEQLIKKYRK